jgi:predicted DsbA family dithiol-disulfide isomerase
VANNLSYQDDDMHALLWRDYLCPWCYLGRDTTSLMEQLGVVVVPMAYELHPEVPFRGRSHRPGGRLDRLLDHIANECELVGLPFRKPTHTPNTRRALEIAEVLRTTYPESFPIYDEQCYRTHWVTGGDLGDPDSLTAIVEGSGADPGHVEELLGRGLGGETLAESMRAAHELGVTATPAWWVDDRLLIPGVQARPTVQRWITRLAERTEGERPQR